MWYAKFQLKKKKKILQTHLMMTVFRGSLWDITFPFSVSLV